jgi:hypothetical protein
MVTGIIYKIECNETNEVYYGSTQQSLKQRMAQHKSHLKMWKEGKYHFTTSFNILDRGNYSYSFIKTVECENRHQLEAVERQYIENNNCTNKIVVGRTKQEYMKAYIEANKDIIKFRNKECMRKFREAHKTEINENRRQRYLKQKQLLKEQTN